MLLTSQVQSSDPRLDAGFADGVLVLHLQDALQPFQLEKLLALCRPGANGHCLEAGWFNSLSCASRTDASLNLQAHVNSDLHYCEPCW